MLRQIVIGVALMTPVPVVAQSIEVRVDPRVELFAALFHLAGREEYNSARVPRWVAAVDSPFRAFSGHPAAQMTERLAKQNRVGFFVPMNLAVHVTNPPELTTGSPFAETVSLHRTWTTFPDSTRVYLDRVRAYAAEARFADLLRAQAAVIDTAQVRLRRLVETHHVDGAWFNRFWGGAPRSRLVIVPALMNGGASYGIEVNRPNAPGEGYAIIGISKVDGAGLPTFDTSTVSTIIHELNHPYVTPLVRAHLAAFRPFADSLLAPVAQRMRGQGYGSWDAVLNESLVRAAVVRYQLTHGGKEVAEPTIVDETRLGFVWTRELVELLGEYERDRAKYPSMDDFMPRVVQFFRDFAPRIRSVVPPG